VPRKRAEIGETSTRDGPPINKSIDLGPLLGQLSTFGAKGYHPRHQNRKGEGASLSLAGGKYVTNGQGCLTCGRRSHQKDLSSGTTRDWHKVSIGPTQGLLSGTMAGAKVFTRSCFDEKKTKNFRTTKQAKDAGVGVDHFSGLVVWEGSRP